MDNKKIKIELGYNVNEEYEFGVTPAEEHIIHELICLNYIYSCSILGDCISADDYSIN